MIWGASLPGYVQCLNFNVNIAHVCRWRKMKRGRIHLRIQCLCVFVRDGVRIAAIVKKKAMRSAPDVHPQGMTELVVIRPKSTHLTSLCLCGLYSHTSSFHTCIQILNVNLQPVNWSKSINNYFDFFQVPFVLSFVDCMSGFGKPW